uniref:Uncharacterized protein n=1 Tax=Tanacetum cinerariifolium TaxID=118510 RepID=A0A6L2M793_TANCI|nr:hypothetical protein [Tanacetum cinerariifolium]
MSMDDLSNNLKVYEPKVKGMSSSSSSIQNMAFVSSSNNNTSSTNGAVITAQVVNTAHGVSTASTQVNAAYYTNIDNLCDDVICSFFASQLNSPQLVHEDLKQIHPDDMEEMDLRLECRALRNQDNKNKKSSRRSVLVEKLKILSLDEFVNKPEVENYKAKFSEKEPKGVRKNDDAPIIEEYVSNNEEEDVSQPKIEKKTVRPSIAKIEFVKSKQQEKTAS